MSSGSVPPSINVVVDPALQYVVTPVSVFPDTITVVPQIISGSVGAEPSVSPPIIGVTISPDGPSIQVVPGIDTPTFTVSPQLTSISASVTPGETSPLILVNPNVHTLASSASYAVVANTAISASWADSSADAYAAISSSFAEFAAETLDALRAVTASYATKAGAADSVAGIFESASYAETASYASSAPLENPYVGDVVITGSVTSTNTVEAGRININSTDGIFVISASVTRNISNVTQTIQPTISMTEFRAASIEYVAQRQGNIDARIGTVMGVWDINAPGGPEEKAKFTEVSTTDIGDTSSINAKFLEVNGYIQFQFECGPGDPWTVQSVFKLFPNLS